MRKVTRALEHVSAARLTHDRKAITASHHYTEHLVQLIGRICASEPDLEHVLTNDPGKGKVCLIVFGSDRGLCGAFNTSLMERAEAFIKEQGRDNVELMIVGKVPARYARRHDLAVRSTDREPSRAGRAAVLDHLVEVATQDFLDKRYRQVLVLYTRFISTMQQEPHIQRLLPARPITPESTPFDRWPSFEPSAQQILERLLPEYTRQMIDNAFLNSLGSEDAARQMSMARATENAGEILGELRQTYSRLRQESITTEMLELAAGSFARRKKGEG